MSKGSRGRTLRDKTIENSAMINVDELMTKLTDTLAEVVEAKKEALEVQKTIEEDVKNYESGC